MKKKIEKIVPYQVLLGALTLVALLLATTLIVLYAKGYRLEQKGLSQTGQLVLKSTPDAASVFVNGKFVAATNSVLNLSPGEYTVKIVKDGYAAWQKKLKIEAEVVTPTDAILWPSVPELRRWTITGALNPTVSPDGTRIAYGVDSSTAYPPQNGVYVADISDRQQLFGSAKTQYVVRDAGIQFSKGKFLFSPDGQQLLVWFENSVINGEESIPQENSSVQSSLEINLAGVTSAYLFDVTSLNDGTDVPDVSLTLDQTLESWQGLATQEKANQYNFLKKDLRRVATSSMEILSFSADESKFMYAAKKDMEIPVLIKPRIIGANTIPENRKIKKDYLYIYDIREDRNYPIITNNNKISENLYPAESEGRSGASESQNQISDSIDVFSALSDTSQISVNPESNLFPRWLATSRHYITVESNKIYVTEYDGTNKTVLYSGPFEKNFVVPTASGTRILFLTTLSPGLPLNLYALLIR